MSMDVENNVYGGGYESKG